jgi:hypothetical protein
MTLKETYSFFESLKNNTSNTSEIKIYEKFLHVLSELKTREFSNEDLAVLETELDNLNLLSNPKNKTKYFKKALNKFKTFLKDTFSIITKGYYTNLGLALGTSLGILFGIIFLSSWERSTGIALGIGLGMVIGLTIGKSIDIKAKSESKVL